MLIVDILCCVVLSLKGNRNLKKNSICGRWIYYKVTPLSFSNTFGNYKQTDEGNLTAAP